MSTEPPMVGATVTGDHPATGPAAGPDDTISTPAGRVDRFGVALVLIALAVAVDFSPITAGWAGVLSVALGTATLVFVLTASDANPVVVRALRVIAIAAVVLAATSVLSGDGHRAPEFVFVIGATLAFVVPIVIARRLLREPVISVHTVLGGLCLYLLLGLLFAYVFAFVNAEAGPFFVQAGASRLADFVYFSYITMATVGYGDLAPGSDLARMLAVADGITGQLFLVTVVAFLLGNIGTRRPVAR
jgi:Ion channel